MKKNSSNGMSALHVAGAAAGAAETAAVAAAAAAAAAASASVSASASASVACAASEAASTASHNTRVRTPRRRSPEAKPLRRPTRCAADAVENLHRARNKRTEPQFSSQPCCWPHPSKPVAQEHVFPVSEEQPKKLAKTTTHASVGMTDGAAECAEPETSDEQEEGAAAEEESGATHPGVDTAAATGPGAAQAAQALVPFVGPSCRGALVPFVGDTVAPTPMVRMTITAAMVEQAAADLAASRRLVELIDQTRRQATAELNEAEWTTDRMSSMMHLHAAQGLEPPPGASRQMRPARAATPHPCLAPRWSSWATKFRGFTLQLTAAQQEVARREALVNTMREGLALAQAAREKRRLVEQKRQVLREAERALAIAGGAEMEAPPPGAPRLPEQYQFLVG